MGRAGQQGRGAAWAGLTSGSAAVATTAPSSSPEATSHAAPGSGRRRQHRLRPPRVGRFQEGGPSSLRVRESGRRASPALSERLRPARAGTSPAAPRPESTRRTAASAAVAVSAGAAGASAAASHSPCGTLSSHRQPPPRPSSAQARAPPTPRTRPRPARFPGCRRAGARTLTSHAPYRLPVPARPPHVTPPESTSGACAGTPHSSAPGGPAQTFLPHLTAELGTVPQILTPTGEECRKVGVENSGFATVALAFRPIQRCLKAGWGGEARGR